MTRGYNLCGANFVETEINGAAAQHLTFLEIQLFLLTGKPKDANFVYYN